MYFPSHISVSSSGASFVIFLCGGVQPEKCRILQAKHNYFWPYFECLCLRIVITCMQCFLSNMLQFVIRIQC
jgi:hypothetical protein